MTPTRPALRWHGGKWLLASWIISHDFKKFLAVVNPRFCEWMMGWPQGWTQLDQS